MALLPCPTSVPQLSQSGARSSQFCMALLAATATRGRAPAQKARYGSRAASRSKSRCRLGDTSKVPASHERHRASQKSLYAFATRASGQKRRKLLFIPSHRPVHRVEVDAGDMVAASQIGRETLEFRINVWAQVSHAGPHRERPATSSLLQPACRDGVERNFKEGLGRCEVELRIEVRAVEAVAQVDVQELPRQTPVLCSSR